MDSQEDPLRHFQGMMKLASELQPLPAQILEHTYNYSACGSWWTTVQRKGITFRVVLDGKEGQMRLEQARASPATQWKAVRSWPVRRDGGAAAIPEVVAHLRVV
jgi:hypothetical protein